ncbi:hypothetical protein [Sphingomonas sp. IC4-52]|uniref:hypothetical protein n=1 Tax=Sphingomonas sp. IC4-52 TaxID=2887202 RepID=UPI001D1063F4|nr:hypothetical protein [Sphingomonas sp. IC4-52]MCC2980976.1 hypothetical protein [Sphingomonas sp. IC4-52]
MLSKLRHAREAYQENREGGDHPGGNWITPGENGKIAFAPTRPDGQQLVIGGQSVTFWEADTLGPMLDAFEAAINAGELDPQLTGPTPAGHSLPLERLVRASSS